LRTATRKARLKDKPVASGKVANACGVGETRPQDLSLWKKKPKKKKTLDISLECEGTGDREKNVTKTLFKQKKRG